MENIIKIGTEVKYRACFGAEKPTNVVVTRIERSEYKRDKYGEEVDSVPFEEREYCVFDLNNGHWCYGEQIDEIVDVPKVNLTKHLSHRHNLGF